MQALAPYLHFVFTEDPQALFLRRGSILKKSSRRGANRLRNAKPDPLAQGDTSSGSNNRVKRNNGTRKKTSDRWADDESDQRSAKSNDRELGDTNNTDEGHGLEGGAVNISADWAATDDPVRMYLMQMGQIPLLSRVQENAAAKEIERTTTLYRHSM